MQPGGKAHREAFLSSPLLGSEAQCCMFADTCSCILQTVYSTHTYGIIVALRNSHTLLPFLCR